MTAYVFAVSFFCVPFFFQGVLITNRVQVSTTANDVVLRASAAGLAVSVAVAIVSLGCVVVQVITGASS